jgi:cyclophilin family peptidyl-prolyl cis-trans isomerase
MFSTATLAFVFLAAQSAAAPAKVQAPAAAPDLPTPTPKPTPDGPVIAFDTTLGTFQVALYATKAPLSTRNIMNYVKSGFYTGTIFHRVIPRFMVQGGGLDANMNEKPTSAPVRNEAKNGLLNTRGSLSLARTNDPHSATSQFFISVKDNPALDFGISRDGWGYAVFGEVVSGMEIVDQIVAVPTSTRGPHQNVPITPVVINKVRVISEPASATPPAATKATAPSGTKPAARPRVAPKATPAAKAKPSPSPSND